MGSAATMALLLTQSPTQIANGSGARFPFLHRYDKQRSLLVKLLDLCYYAEARR
jgi:hypothetical protein